MGKDGSDDHDRHPALGSLVKTAERTRFLLHAEHTCRAVLDGADQTLKLDGTHGIKH